MLDSAGSRHLARHKYKNIVFFNISNGHNPSAYSLECSNIIATFLGGSLASVRIFPAEMRLTVYRRRPISNYWNLSEGVACFCRNLPG